MICEKCGAQLIEGFYKCPECGHFIPDPYADDTEIYVEDEIPETIKNPTLQTVTKNCSQTDYAKILKPVIKSLVAIIIICAVTLSALLIANKIKNAPPKPEDTLNGIPQSNDTITATTVPAVPSQNGQINQIQQQIQQQQLQSANKDTPEYKAYSSQGFTALISGNFYMDCDIDDGSGNMQNFKMAYSGDNMEMTCDTDGMILTIMKINGKNYFVDLPSKTYINLSDTLINLMGIDPSELELDTGLPTTQTKFTFGETEQNSVKYTTASYYDTSGLKSTLFIAEDGTVTKMESYSGNGAIIGYIKINNLTGVIPSNLLTTQGYKSTSIITFVNNIMEQQGVIE